MDTFIGAFIPKSSFPLGVGPGFVLLLSGTGNSSGFVFPPCSHRGKCGYKEVAKAAGAEPEPEFVSPFLCPVPGWLLATGRLCCGCQPYSLGSHISEALKGSGQPEFPCRHLEPPGIHLGSCSCIPGRVGGSPGI